MIDAAPADPHHGVVARREILKFLNRSASGFSQPIIDLRDPGRDVPMGAQRSPRELAYSQCRPAETRQEDARLGDY